MAITITPDDYLGNPTNENVDIEEIQSHQLDQRASNYAQRQQNTYTPQGGDFELIELQGKLSRSTNPLEQIQLEQQIQSLAESLVGHKPAPKAKSSYDAKTEVMNEFGEETYNKTMQWASDSSMSDATVASINEVLQSDSEDAVVAFQGLQDLSGLSDEAFTSVDQVQSMSEDLVNHLSERFGQAGEQLATLNAALANGHASSSDVLKLALTNPQLRNAAITAAREGLINIVL